MTEEERILLNELKANTKQLFQAFHKVEAEKKLLEEQLAFLKNEMARIEGEKTELGWRNNNLEMANRILSGNDENHEARNRINKVIREIDKCISLLNE